MITLTGDGSSEDCAIEIVEGFEHPNWVYGDPCIDWDPCEETCELGG